MSRTTAEDAPEIGFRLTAETRPGRLCPSTEYKADNRHIRNARPPSIDDRLAWLLGNHVMCLDDAAYEALRELRIYGESLCKSEKGESE